MKEQSLFVVPILVSALATFLVRALPYYIKIFDHLPKFLSKCLRLLPIAALGPLIFPGVLLDYGPRFYASLGGILAAFLFAYHKRGMIIPILLSILITYLLLL